MIALYASVYGGPPASESPWPLFLMLVGKASQLLSREQLRFYDAVVGGISAALSTGNAAKIERDVLVSRSFDLKTKPVIFHENRFSPEYGGAADA